MKKLMLSMALLAGVWVNASAQQDVKFGIKGGVTLPNSVSYDAENNRVNTSNIYSFYVGGTVSIPISKRFTLQPGLVFIGKGMKQNDSYSFASYKMDYTVKIDNKISPFYIEVPVNLVANFANKRGSFFVGAGPYYAIGVAGKGKYDVTETINSETTKVKVNRDLVFGDKKESDLKRGDFGANFLFGYQWESGFNVHLNYGLGLRDINVDREVDIKVMNVALAGGLGFTF